MALKDTLLKERDGFVTGSDLPQLIKENRFTKVLVRCGGCRFITTVQDVEHLVGIIDNSKNTTNDSPVNKGINDYVRDVSIFRGEHN